MRIRPYRAASLVAAGLLIAALTTDTSSRAARPADPPTPTGPAVLPLGNTGNWMTDADGRVVVLRGLNQVYKVPPYEPSADGFCSPIPSGTAPTARALRLGPRLPRVDQRGRRGRGHRRRHRDTVMVES
jgi:hypothetical protein